MQYMTCSTEKTSSVNSLRTSTGKTSTTSVGTGERSAGTIEGSVGTGERSAGTIEGSVGTGERSTGTIEGSVGTGGRSTGTIEGSSSAVDGPAPGDSDSAIADHCTRTLTHVSSMNKSISIFGTNMVGKHRDRNGTNGEH